MISALWLIPTLLVGIIAGVVLSAAYALRMPPNLPW